MIKKVFTLVFLALLTSGSVHAQIEQGSKMVGGLLSLDLAFDDDDDATQFSFSPRYGVFVVDRIALGGDLGIDYAKIGDETSATQLSIGPFARLYVLGSGDLKMLLDARASYIFSKIKDSDLVTKDHGFQFFGGPGLSYFLGDNVSLDIILGYNYRTFGEDAVSSNLKLVAGFQIFL